MKSGQKDGPLGKLQKRGIKKKNVNPRLIPHPHACPETGLWGMLRLFSRHFNISANVLLTPAPNSADFVLFNFQTMTDGQTLAKKKYQKFINNKQVTSIC